MSEELEQMCRAHFNEPVIFVSEVARCIGYGEDDRDCYIIARHFGGKVMWHTCVGGYVWLDRLKGQGYVKAYNDEDWDDLFRLDSFLSLNGSPREAEFIVDRTERDAALSESKPQEG